MKNENSRLICSRRSLLKGALAASLFGVMRGGELQAAPGAAPPVLWVQLFAVGGWDQMLFCDPKLGPRVSSSGGFFDISQLKQVASIPYVDAYDAANPTIRPVDPFFQEFGDRLLVINGVDTTTNNHDVGTRYWMSGSLLEGFPIFAAQVAGVLGQGKPMPLVDISGYDDCGGLVAPVRLDYIGVPKISQLRHPNQPPPAEWSQVSMQSTVTATELLADGPLARVHAAQQARLLRLKQNLGLPSHATALAAWEKARAAVPGLANLDIPSLGSNSVESAKALATMGIRAYGAGLATTMTVAAGSPDLDSHGIDDYRHLEQLGVVFDLARHIANTADAEPKPVPTIIVMSSDFGRTPVRESAGSGHWPVASMMVLQNNAAKALNILPSGKVIGGTTGTPEGPNDEQTVLRVRKINPATHAFDDAGTALSPAHVFRALRRIAGVADDNILRSFPINIDGGELDLLA
ncbi:MAG TPA: hypothetical protein PK156_36435 [Polyangium sp.]|nr:hypothetical protein [Polyangium sp.]